MEKYFIILGMLLCGAGALQGISTKAGKAAINHQLQQDLKAIPSYAEWSAKK